MLKESCFESDNTAAAEMSIVKTFPVSSWQIEAAEAAPASLLAAASVYRERASAPLRKLTVGLIHTYKLINEVSAVIVSVTVMYVLRYVQHYLLSVIYAVLCQN